MNYKLESTNNIYEVINFKPDRGLFNTYVQKTSKLTENYIGEAVVSIQTNDPVMNLKLEDVINLEYL